MKEKIMSANTIDDLIEIESEAVMQFRNDFYNKLLKDEEIKKHICEIFKIDEKVVQNVLMINGYPPLDYFEVE